MAYVPSYKVKHPEDPGVMAKLIVEEVLEEATKKGGAAKTTDFSQQFEKELSDAIEGADGIRPPRSGYRFLFDHIHKLKSENPDLKEEVVEEGDFMRKYWKLEPAIADHFTKSLASKTHVSENRRESRRSVVDLVNPDVGKEIGKVWIPSDGFPQPRDDEDKLSVANVNQCNSSLSSSIHQMYRLAECMDFEANSEEAEIFLAALEAMGCANYITKMVQAKFQAEILGDPLVRRHSVQSWDSLPGTLWDMEKLKRDKIKLRSDVDLIEEPPKKKKKKSKTSN